MSKRTTAVLGLLYVISPIDLLPDVIPILGWLDDIGVIGFVITKLCQSGNPGPAEEIEQLRAEVRELRK